MATTSPARPAVDHSLIGTRLHYFEVGEFVELLRLCGAAHSRRKFTVMLEGLTNAKLPWVVAVHLDDTAGEGDKRGSGACGHAAFHCHVGPTLGRTPKVRVPFPAVGALAAVDWVFTLVVPEWEPAEWAKLP